MQPFAGGGVGAVCQHFVQVAHQPGAVAIKGQLLAFPDLRIADDTRVAGGVEQRVAIVGAGLAGGPEFFARLQGGFFNGFVAGFPLRLVVIAAQCYPAGCTVGNGEQCLPFFRFAVGDSGELTNILGERRIRVLFGVLRYFVRAELRQGGAQPVEVEIGLQGVLLSQGLLLTGKGFPVIVACCVQCLVEVVAIRSGNDQRRKQTAGKQC